MVDLAGTFKILPDALDVDQSLLFPSPQLGRPKGHSYRVPQAPSRRQWRESPLSMRAITDNFASAFKKRSKQVWTVTFSHPPPFVPFSNINRFMSMCNQ